MMMKEEITMEECGIHSYYCRKKNDFRLHVAVVQYSNIYTTVSMTTKNNNRIKQSSTTTHD